MITEGQVLDIAKDAIYYIIICSAPDLMVELQYLSWIGLTYGAVFIFIGKF